MSNIEGLAAILVLGLVLLPLIIGVAARLTYRKAVDVAEQPLIRLNQRLANGEITEEEYLRIKSLLAESLYAEKAKREANIRLSDDGELLNELDSSQERAAM